VAHGLKVRICLTDAGKVCLLSSITPEAASCRSSVRSPNLRAQGVCQILEKEGRRCRSYATICTSSAGAKFRHGPAVKKPDRLSLVLHGPKSVVSCSLTKPRRAGQVWSARPARAQHADEESIQAALSFVSGTRAFIIRHQAKSVCARRHPHPSA
jgi:hypothetical protein